MPAVCLPQPWQSQGCEAAVTNAPDDRKWAEIRFLSPVQPEVSEDLLKRVAGVYRQQARDGERFAAARTELAKRVDLSGGAVVGMAFDHRFSRLFENWVAACDRFAIECRSHTMIFATDAGARQVAQRLGFVVYHDEESELLAAMTESGSYGDQAWTAYMYHQNWVIRTLLEFGQDFGADVLFQDVDVVWRRNPLPTLAATAGTGVDVQAMYDGPNARFQPLYANSGFMYFRNTASVRDFWAEVYSRHDMVGYFRSQQEPLNVILAAYAHRGLDVLVLDEERFANGHLYCGNRTAPPDPWVVHHSWTANFEQKLVRYVESDLWFLPQESSI